ncbi:MAG: VWA domain-containing protein [Phycisphaerae bacterium]
MTDLLEQLLDLERVSLDAEALSIELGVPPARWAMLAGVILTLTLVAIVYRYERGSRRLRLGLAAIRTSILLASLGLMAFPVLVLTQERIDRSVVAILLDRSASMMEPNNAGHGATPSSRPTSESDAPEETRFDRALALLTSSEDGPVAQLAAVHRVELWTFDRSAQRIARDAADADLQAIADDGADGKRTDLAAALSEVFEQLRGSRLAAVVVLSDGRQTASADLTAVTTEAHRRDVAVHTVAIGSPRRRADLELIHAAADEDVFRRDIVSVSTRIAVAGIASPLDIPVRLIDQDSGTLLEERTIRFDPAREPESPPEEAASPAGPLPGAQADDEHHLEVEFHLRPERIGRMALRIEAGPLPEERRTGNNAADLVVRVHDEKIRVLYVDGPPRFEYRFLKNTLLREPTAEASCLLLDATAGFVQEGDRAIQQFPVSPGQLADYDVVLLGDVDVRGDWISPAQLAMLVDFVGVRGGGLGFIAGERAMPHRLAGTPLEKLLPVRLESGARNRESSYTTQPYVLQPTPLGRRHPLLRFEADALENDATLAALEPWYWFAGVRSARAGAEVLATHPEVSAARDAMPLLVIGRYGAGRVFYVGSDDVWRWRRYHGESYYDTFWLNALRLLAGERRWGASRAWRLESDRRFHSEPSRVTFRLTAREEAVAAGMPDVQLQIRNTDGDLVARRTLERIGSDAMTFESSFLPRRAGVYFATAMIDDPGGQAEPPSCAVTVFDRAPEQRRPEADHRFLRELAGATGGRFLRSDQLHELADAIPDRTLYIPDQIVEPLWDTRLVLLLITALAGTEWVARKLKGMP